MEHETAMHQIWALIHLAGYLAPNFGHHRVSHTVISDPRQSTSIMLQFPSLAVSKLTNTYMTIMMIHDDDDVDDVGDDAIIMMLLMMIFMLMMHIMLMLLTVMMMMFILMMTMLLS